MTGGPGPTSSDIKLGHELTGLVKKTESVVRISFMPGGEDAPCPRVLVLLVFLP